MNILYFVCFWIQILNFFNQKICFVVVYSNKHELDTILVSPVLALTVLSVQRIFNFCNFYIYIRYLNTKLVCSIFNTIFCLFIWVNTSNNTFFICLDKIKDDGFFNSVLLLDNTQYWLQSTRYVRNKRLGEIK